MQLYSSSENWRKQPGRCKLLWICPCVWKHAGLYLLTKSCSMTVFAKQIWLFEHYSQKSPHLRACKFCELGTLIFHILFCVTIILQSLVANSDTADLSEDSKSHHILYQVQQICLTTRVFWHQVKAVAETKVSWQSWEVVVKFCTLCRNKIYVDLICWCCISLNHSQI